MLYQLSYLAGRRDLRVYRGSFGARKHQRSTRNGLLDDGGNLAMAETVAIDPKASLTGADALEKLRELLANFPIATMVTVEQKGAITARPIGVVGDHAAFDGQLWFITDRRSRKVQAINGGAVTFLIFEDHDQGAYLHLTGRAHVVEDRARLETLYTPVQRTWFPEGLDDPHMTLIRFDADQGEFWDKHNGLLRLAAAFAKAIVTGSPGSSGNTGTARL